MVTFCTGNSLIKRQAFRSAASVDTISVDNDEVLATFSIQGKLYVAVGTVPYSDMTVEQYIACTRALISRQPLNRYKVKELLAAVGLKISHKRKMVTLSRVEYRAVNLAARLTENTRTIFINFDGLDYNKNNAKKFNTFVYCLAKNYEVFVGVSDTRFVPINAPRINYTQNGIESTKIQMRSKTAFKWTLCKKLVKSGMDIVLPKIQKVVVCEN